MKANVGETVMKLDELFAEVAPLIKKSSDRAEPYGRDKDYDWAAVKADIAAGFRVCTKCRQRISITEFSKRTAHVTGYKAWCKACDKVAFTAHRANNLEAMRARERASHYKSTYGLSTELATVLANPASRLGRCPLCRDTEHLVLDHDHVTGKVRDLICTQCNKMLGHARDSLDILYEAIAYLKKHKGV